MKRRLLMPEEAGDASQFVKYWEGVKLREQKWERKHKILSRTHGNLWFAGRSIKTGCVLR